MKNDFKFCPQCASVKIENCNNIKWKCPDCGFVLYSNVAAAVGVIIQDKQKNVLFEMRAKEPRKGFLCLPGGFVDRDETAENAIIRECREEIGVNIDKVRFLCTFPNTYPYKEIEYKTCDIFFIADLPARFASIDEFIGSLTAEESEVLGFCSRRVESLADVMELPLAFDSARETLKRFLEVGGEKHE